MHARGWPFSPVFPQKEQYHSNRYEAVSDIECGEASHTDEICHKAVIEAINDICERSAEDHAERDRTPSLLAMPKCEEAYKEQCERHEKRLQERMKCDPECNAAIFDELKSEKLSEKRNARMQRCLDKETSEN